MAKRSTLLNPTLLAISLALIAGPAFAADDATAAAIAKMKTWDSGDPTPAEQHVLEVINRARKDPQAEGKRLGIDITESLAKELVPLVGPRPPLAMNGTLLKVARAHAQDMDKRNFFAHNNPDGKTPFDRVGDAGYAYSLAGENIAAGGANDADSLEDLLMVDATVPTRGHRINLLNIWKPPYEREIGIGSFTADAPNANKTADFLTEDFGNPKDSRPFILGVVYHDDKGSGFYAIGEGFPGVIVSPDVGEYKAVTGAAGGYAFPVDPGVHTITFDFGVHGTVVKTVTVGEDNVKVDALTSEARKTKKKHS